MVFSTSCSQDYLAIYDGYSVSDPLLGKFCGSKLPPNVKSSNNSMLLVFKTDSFQTARGWKISFRQTLGKNFGHVNLFFMTATFCFILFHLIKVAFHLSLEKCHTKLWFFKLLIMYSFFFF